MKVIDATRNSARPLWRSWRRRLQGAITRTIASSTPRETWRRELPALDRAADAAMRAQLEHQYHEHGRDADNETINAFREGRAEAEALMAATMGPKRCVQILVHAGVDFERAMQLLEAVGPDATKAIGFADVIDIVVLDEEARGAS